MTTALAPARPHDLVTGEWIKLRSLRSTYFMLLAAMVIALAIGMLVCNVDASQATRPLSGRQAAVDPLTDSFVGFVISQLIFAALGVLAMTGEYSSGLIRTTFAAVPARRAVLAAKAAVIFALTLTAGLVTALTAFLAGQAILSTQHLGISLSHPGAARAIIAAGLFLPAVALTGLALGVLLRSTAGALTVLIAVLFVVPELLNGTSQWVIDIANALPATAIRRLVSLHPMPHAPSVTECVIVMIAYPAVTLAAAAIVLHRRDA
jgi:ABC-2 type transport system permease protein